VQHFYDGDGGFEAGTAYSGSETKEAAHRAASLIRAFNIRRFEPAGRGVLTPVDRQNRKRRPAVGAQLLKTW
jgi:hypothetical protein